jgi:hypothetical protein
MGENTSSRVASVQGSKHTSSMWTLEVAWIVGMGEDTDMPQADGPSEVWQQALSPKGTPPLPINAPAQLQTQTPGTPPHTHALPPPQTLSTAATPQAPMQCPKPKHN